MLHKGYIVLLALLLAACGFEPLYVEKKHNNAWYFDGDFDTSISQEMEKIKVQSISDRFGQILQNELIDLLTPKGQPSDPKYRLFVRLSQKKETDQALRSDITATRKMVKYTVVYYMTSKNGERLLEGDSVAYTSYDILANPYSTTMAKKKSDQEVAKMISNDISLRLGAYFHTIATENKAKNDL